MDEYTRAVRRADALARRLGTPWKPMVWENLGWHYRAVMPKASVTESHGKRYLADIHVGRQFMAEAGSPREAVARAVRSMEKELSMWMQDRVDFLELLGDR